MGYMQTGGAESLRATIANGSNPGNFFVIDRPGGWRELRDDVEERLDHGYALLISFIERVFLNGLNRCQSLDEWQILTLCSIARRLGLKP